MKSLALGLMSGTSADGVSAAAGTFSRKKFHLAGYRTYPFPYPLRLKIRNAHSLTTPELSRLNFELGQVFAAAALRFLKDFKIPRRHITVAGSHGQTVYHGPLDRPANTLQIGEPSFLAEALGVPVVADFRPRDMAAGGEGAPLIPYFDHFFFGDGPVTALQNIGGIGNVTVTGRGAKPVAFDTGPGNTLMDFAVKKLSGGKITYDREGRLAARGRLIIPALETMCRHPYFKRKPPKSTGPELFSEHFIPRLLWRHTPEDTLATLNFFTAWTIAESYRLFLPGTLSRVIISGGGALNQTLVMHLAALLHPVPVISIDSFGLPPQAKEPLAFAFFAWRAIHGQINHSPEGTRASGARILGKIIPAGSFHANA